MTLVIRNKNIILTEGTKLYRDALVTVGTVYLTDLSNRGATQNGAVKNGDKIFDLGRESSLDMDVNAEGYIVTNKADSALTAKKGFSAIGISGNGAFGVNIPDVLDYLTNNKTHKFLFSIWVNTGTTGNSLGFIRSYGGGTDWTNTAFRANISNTGNLTMTIGGAVISGATFLPAPNTDARIAYLYQGVGLPLKVWVNGVYKGETPAVTTGFDAIGKTIVIGKPEISALGSQTFYRMLIEDLDVSGRNADDVVQKDYNYVNAIGEYTGIPKRPYANL